MHVARMDATHSVGLQLWTWESDIFAVNSEPTCPVCRERCCLISLSDQLQNDPEKHKKVASL